MKKYKFSDILTLVLFLGFIFGFGVWFWLQPDVDKLPGEGGKVVQTMPSFNGEGNEHTGTDYLIHGELADDFDEYYCDQFPLRRFFLGLKSSTEVAFGRDVNNGVYCYKGELAATRFDAVGTAGNSDSFSKDHVKGCLASLNELCTGLGTDIAVMLPPRAIDVKGETMNYPTDNTEAIDALIKEGVDEKYLIDLLDTMQALNKTGEKPYFTTDHHWTVTGAYYAYVSLMEHWGLTPYGLEDFRFETFTEDFKGTALRNGNYFYLDGEALVLARYDGDEDFTVSNLNYMLKPTTSYDGLYDMDANPDDAYSVFLHGKPGQMSIVKEGAERDKLLVYKDSFGHSLVPFLARHFDIYIIDIDENKVYGLDMSAAVEAVKPDRVLLVYNVENLITNDRLGKIK